MKCYELKLIFNPIYLLHEYEQYPHPLDIRLVWYAQQWQMDQMPKKIQ